MKMIIYRPKHKSETEPQKDLKDIFTSVLAWLCIIFPPVTIITAVVLKINNEIGFWRWIFQGMPEMPKHRWYALSVVCTIGFCGFCAVVAVIDAVSEKIRKNKRTAEDEYEKKRQEVAATTERERSATGELTSLRSPKTRTCMYTFYRQTF